VRDISIWISTIGLVLGFSISALVIPSSILTKVEAKKLYNRHITEYTVLTDNMKSLESGDDMTLSLTELVKRVATWNEKYDDYVKGSSSKWLSFLYDERTYKGMDYIDVSVIDDLVKK
jgi:hypothetical protein